MSRTRARPPSSPPPPPPDGAQAPVPVELFQPVGPRSAATGPPPLPRPPRPLPASPMRGDALGATPTPLPPPGLVTAQSRAEQRIRHRQAQAQRAERNPHFAVTAEAQAAKNNRSHLTGLSVLSLEDQQRLASEIVETFGHLALERDPNTGQRSETKVSASARKNFATAWGIGSDKLAMLQGRPRQPQQPTEEADTQRPAVLDLVRKLAAVRADRPA